MKIERNLKKYTKLDTLMIKKPIFLSILKESSLQARKDIIIEKINEIQNINGRKLIVYVTNSNMPNAMITREDVFGFEDILSSINHENKGDLLINSPGGVPNAADKIVLICKNHFTEVFNTIIPDYAKSAATLIALGSDKIYMGHSAELGPIDPQIQIRPDRPYIPAQSYISGLNYVRERIKKENDPIQMYYPILSKIEPEYISICLNSIKHAKELAEAYLKNGMLQSQPQQAEKVAKLLCEGIEYKSHGKVIDFNEAKINLKLNVELIDKNSELWRYIWELYLRCKLILEKSNGANLFAFEKEVIIQTVVKE